jgi:hypothetical protein
MPFSAGTFSRIYNWAVEQASAPIEIAKLDTQEDDVATALSTCLLRDGTGLPTANLDWNGKKITNLANASASTDALNMATGDTRYFSISSSATIATDRLVGRDTAGTGAVEAITVGGGIEFTGTAGIQTSALTGDVTKTAGGTATTIASAVVTNAKLATMSTATVKGQTSGGSGAPVDLTAAQLVTIINTADGTGTGLDSDLLDGQHGSFYQSASNLNAGTIPDARIQASGVTQHQSSINSGVSIAASQVASGTMTDARIAQSNVTQHAAAVIAAANVTSGTYTPTCTNVSNTSTLSGTGQYIRVGNVVTVSGEVTVTITVLIASWTVSLPVASDLTATSHLAGTATESGTATVQALNIKASTTADAALFSASNSVSTGAHTFSFEFTYRVQ